MKNLKRFFKLHAHTQTLSKKILNYEGFKIKKICRTFIIVYF